MITDQSPGSEETRQREMSRESHEESRIGQLRSRAVEKMSGAASYVRERGVRGLTDDLSQVTAKHPLTAVAACLGVGYLIGRLMSSRRMDHE